MRIAHVTATFPSYYAGTGNVCFYNARELAALGHDVRVITGRQRFGHRDSIPGVMVQCLPTVLRLGNAPLLPHLMSVRGVDIIHLHMPFIFGAELTWLNTQFRRLPYVITYHNSLIGDSYRRLPFACYERVVTPLVLRSAARLLPNSLDYARASRLSSLFTQLGSKVVEMPNGVDVDLFHPGVDSNGLRRRYGLARDDLVVLFVAALDRAHFFKGLEARVESCRRPEGLDDVDHKVKNANDSLDPIWERRIQKASLGYSSGHAGIVRGRGETSGNGEAS